jgi:hypothetical protein
VQKMEEDRQTITMPDKVINYMRANFNFDFSYVG